MADEPRCPPARRAVLRARETRWTRALSTVVTAENRWACDRNSASPRIPVRLPEWALRSMAIVAPQAAAMDARSEPARPEPGELLRQDAPLCRRLRSRRFYSSAPDRWDALRQAGSKP